MNNSERNYPNNHLFNAWIHRLFPSTFVSLSFAVHPHVLLCSDFDRHSHEMIRVNEWIYKGINISKVHVLAHSWNKAHTRKCTNIFIITMTYGIQAVESSDEFVESSRSISIHIFISSNTNNGHHYIRACFG